MAIFATLVPEVPVSGEKRNIALVPELDGDVVVLGPLAPMVGANLENFPSHERETLEFRNVLVEKNQRLCLGGCRGPRGPLLLSQPS